MSIEGIKMFGMAEFIVWEVVYLSKLHQVLLFQTRAVIHEWCRCETGVGIPCPSQWPEDVCDSTSPREWVETDVHTYLALLSRQAYTEVNRKWWCLLGWEGGSNYVMVSLIDSSTHHNVSFQQQSRLNGHTQLSACWTMQITAKHTNTGFRITYAGNSVKTKMLNFNMTHYMPEV